VPAGEGVGRLLEEMLSKLEEGWLEEASPGGGGRASFSSYGGLRRSQQTDGLRWRWDNRYRYRHERNTMGAGQVERIMFHFFLYSSARLSPTGNFQ
jgi:hypothetical protein